MFIFFNLQIGGASTIPVSARACTSYRYERQEATAFFLFSSSSVARSVRPSVPPPCPTGAQEMVVEETNAWWEGEEGEVEDEEGEFEEEETAASRVLDEAITESFPC